MKKEKRVKSKARPRQREVRQAVDPDEYFSAPPLWSFKMFDHIFWPLDKKEVGDLLWNELLPWMKSIETQVWSEILIVNKKSNHFIDVSTLNKVARDRLNELHLEPESLLSLRITGKHRLYGFREIGF